MPSGTPCSPCSRPTRSTSGRGRAALPPFLHVHFGPFAVDGGGAPHTGGERARGFAAGFGRSPSGGFAAGSGAGSRPVEGWRSGAGRRRRRSGSQPVGRLRRRLGSRVAACGKAAVKVDGHICPSTGRSFFVHQRVDLRNLHKSPFGGVVGRPPRPLSALRLRPRPCCGDWCRFRASAPPLQRRATCGRAPEAPGAGARWGKVAFWAAPTGKIGHFSTLAHGAPLDARRKPQVRSLRDFVVLAHDVIQLTKTTH